MCYLGQAFRDGSGSNIHPGKRHVRFVVTDPDVNAARIVLVNYSTVRQNTFNDPTVILRAGEYPTILHRSYIPFERAEILSRDEIRRKIDQGLFDRMDDVSSYLLKRLRDGLLRSQHAPLRSKRILEDELAKRTDPRK